MSISPNEQPIAADQSTGQTNDPIPRKPLRLWPGLVAVVLQWLLWFVIPFFFPATMMYGMMGALFVPWLFSCGGCSSVARRGLSAWAQSF